MTPTRRNLLQGTAALGLVSALPATARDASQDWSSDVEILRQVWETMHPGLYRYSTPNEITGRLDELARAWSVPGSFRDRFLALTRVTASIRCGHTYPSPYNGDDAMVAGLYPDRSLVPFRFRWLDQRMVVTRDDTGLDLCPAGTVVETINGVSTTSLLQQLIPLARADGSNDPKRVNLMEVRGEDGYEAFDIHLPLILPLSDVADFGLAGGRRVRAPLLNLTERRAGRAASADLAPDANPWRLERRDDGVAHLIMPTWALYNSTLDWRTWLGEALDDLTEEGARGLVVDLRGNEGGEDCGDIIVSRLIGSDLALSQDQRWVRYRRAPESLHPYLDTWDRSFLDWGDQAVASGERPGFYRLTRYDDGEDSSVIRPEGRRFTAPVAVLCDASNSSATFQFAKRVKDNGLACLVGQPTGGNRRGINGGAFFFLQLPQSGLEIDLPLIASFPQTPQPDAPIEPDLYAPTRVEDVINGVDPQMTAALMWIQNTSATRQR